MFLFFYVFAAFVLMLCYQTVLKRIITINASNEAFIEISVFVCAKCCRSENVLKWNSPNISVSKSLCTPVFLYISFFLHVLLFICCFDFVLSWAKKKSKNSKEKKSFFFINCEKYTQNRKTHWGDSWLWNRLFLSHYIYL